MDAGQVGGLHTWIYELWRRWRCDTDVAVEVAPPSSPTVGIDRGLPGEPTPDRAPPGTVEVVAHPWPDRVILEAVFPPKKIDGFYPPEERAERAPQGGPAGPESRIEVTCWGCGRGAVDDAALEALFEIVPVQGLKVYRCRMCGAGLAAFEAGFSTDTDIAELRAHFERTLPGGAVSP